MFQFFIFIILLDTKQDRVCIVTWRWRFSVLRFVATGFPQVPVAYNFKTSVCIVNKKVACDHILNALNKAESYPSEHQRKTRKTMPCSITFDCQMPLVLWVNWEKCAAVKISCWNIQNKIIRSCKWLNYYFHGYKWNYNKIPAPMCTQGKKSTDCCSELTGYSNTVLN